MTPYVLEHDDSLLPGVVVRESPQEVRDRNTALEAALETALGALRALHLHMMVRPENRIPEVDARLKLMVESVLKELDGGGG